MDFNFENKTINEVYDLALIVLKLRLIRGSDFCRNLLFTLPAR